MTKIRLLYYGKIDTINTAANTIKIKTLDRDKQTVSVLTKTKIRNKDGDEIKLSDLKEDDRVLVAGKWSRKKDTITKTKTIDVLDDYDYDDLD